MTDISPFDPALFRDAAIDAETAALNAKMIELMEGQPEWWITGAENARAARRRGEGPFPAAGHVGPGAHDLTIPGKDGNTIPLRVIAPLQTPRGVYLHLHGGGWVLGGADMQDPMLERIADKTGQAVVVGRVPAGAGTSRTRPVRTIARPPPCGSSERSRRVRHRMLTIGGESAGGHLAAVTLLRMRDRHGYTGFRGANLVYGAFDLGMTPSQRQFGNTRLVLRTIDMQQFYNAFLPTITDRRVPDISPLYADLRNLCPALFTVGTKDALLDDTLFMHARWVAAGNEAELAIHPGGAHGFTLFPNALSQAATAPHGRVPEPGSRLRVSARSAASEQRRAEADAAGGRVHVALVGRRIVRLDPQHHKGGAVALAQEPARRPPRSASLATVRVRLIPAPDGDLFEIDAEAGMAFLVAGLAVMAVIDDRIARFAGFSTAIVASAPRFISNSPSPVATRTRLSGRARASPSPIMQAPPIAPAIV